MKMEISWRTVRHALLVLFCGLLFGWGLIVQLFADTLVIINPEDVRYHLYLAPLNVGGQLEIPVPKNGSVTVQVPHDGMYYQVWNDDTTTWTDAGTLFSGSTHNHFVIALRNNTIWGNEGVTVPDSAGGGGFLPDEWQDDPAQAFLDGFWWTIGLGFLVIMAWYARSLGRAQPVI